MCIPPAKTYQLPQNPDRLHENRFTITGQQRRTVDRLTHGLPGQVFDLYCLPVGGGDAERLHTLSESATGQLTIGM